MFVGSVLEIDRGPRRHRHRRRLYPVVKRQNEGVALGLVATRTLEAGAIFAGVFVLLAIVSLRQAGAGAAALVTGQTLVGLHDWTFTLSQSLIPAVNALLLGSLLYQSRLVPRSCPCWASSVRPCSSPPRWPTLFGYNEYGSGLSGLMTLPIAFWEFSLGAYLVIRGFRAAGLQKLGFEPVESAGPASEAAPAAPASELRPAA